MSSTLVILVIEITIVLICVVGFLLFLRWKIEKQKTVDVETVLDDFNLVATKRKKQLVEFFTSKQGLNADQAEESAGCMIEAESNFLKEFLKQQIEQTPLTDFYSNLSGLLDQYLYFIPEKILLATVDDSVDVGDMEKDIPVDKEPEADTITEPSSDDSVMKASEVEEVNQPTDEATDNDMVVEELVSDEVADEEPDWGEAFAESGDVVDEETKAGFDAESKKE